MSQAVVEGPRLKIEFPPLLEAVQWVSDFEEPKRRTCSENAVQIPGVDPAV